MAENCKCNCQKDGYELKFPDGVNPDCPCPNPDCPRHGHCCDCVEFHVSHGKKPPVCLRMEWKEYP